MIWFTTAKCMQLITIPARLVIVPMLTALSTVSNLNTAGPGSLFIRYIDSFVFLSFTVTHIKMYNLLIIFHTVIFVPLFY